MHRTELKHRRPPIFYPPPLMHLQPVTGFMLPAALGDVKCDFRLLKSCFDTVFVLVSGMRKS